MAMEHLLCVFLLVALFLMAVSCQKLTVTLHSCNFERNLCGWSQSSSDDFDWTRASTTPTGLTGPSVDHTLGSNKGHFLFTESSSPRKEGESAVLISQNFSAKWSGSCFQFWYHIYSGAIGMSDSMVGSLEVFVSKPGENLSRLSTSFHVQGNQQDIWHLGQIEVPRLTTRFQIVVNATRGTSYYSDIAIDDVTLFRCSKDSATTQVSTVVTYPTSQVTTATPSVKTTQAVTTTSATPQTTLELVELTKATFHSTIPSKDHNANGRGGKPSKDDSKTSSPAVIGKTQEDEKNESLLPIIIGVSSGVGVVVIVAVIVIVISRMNKRKHNGVETVADDHIYVTPNPPSSFDSSPRSGTLEVCNVTYMSIP